MSRRDEIHRLQDVVERISRIKFSETLLIQSENNENEEIANTAFDAILYDLLVIGEAVKSLSNPIKERNSIVPWENITGMRNILAHEYFRVDGGVVRATIDAPLEILRTVCIEELAQKNNQA